MRELADSSHLVGDGKALRAKVFEDGYLLFRGLIERTPIESARRAVLDGLKQGGWVRGNGDADQVEILPPIHGTDRASLWNDEGYASAATSPAFNALPYLPELQQVMQRLMGSSAFCYPSKVLRILYPVRLVPKYVARHAHTDYAIHKVQDMFTMWVPLMDITRSLGGLAILPGSQCSGSRPSTILPDDEPNWATTEFEPGDVLLFHCLTLHIGLPNHTNGLRISGDFRWQRADDLAARHLVFDRNGIEKLSERFRMMPWWRPVPTGLRFATEESTAVAPSSPPPSRFVSVPSGPWQGTAWG